MVRRYQEHLLGSPKCKYTRSFKPIEIAQCWEVFGDKACALKIEQFIKKMSRNQKKELLLAPECLTQLFQCQPKSIT